MSCVAVNCSSRTTKGGVKQPELSFHTFPKCPELRNAWIKAVRRENWEPNKYSRLCSKHFEHSYFVSGLKIKKLASDAIPTIFEGHPKYHQPLQMLVTEEICRICLATDVKMYSLKNGEMRLYIDSIPGFTEKFITDDGMPEWVCYECAVQLKKCWFMVKKSMQSSKILLDMVTQNGQIDKSLLNINRECLKLKSPLAVHEKTPMSLYHFIYDYEQNISILTNTEFIGKVEEKNDDIRYIPDIWPSITDSVENITLNEEIILKLETENEVKKSDSDCELNNDDHEQEEAIYVVEVKGNMTDDVTNLDPIYVSTEYEVDEKTELLEITKEVESCSKTGKKRNKEPTKKPKKLKVGGRKSSRINGFTPDEIALQKYFNIIQINTLQEQIDDWNEMVGSSQMEGRVNVTKCEVCSKYFLLGDSFRRHVKYHDPRRGNIECPVCKIRFKHGGKLRSHLISIHGRKFHCRSCTKVYRSLTAAKNHQKFHSGHPHKCDHCSYTSMHRSTLFTHITRNHSHSLACEICGRTCISMQSLYQHRAFSHAGYTAPEGGEVFSCEECKLKFNSENALRVHLLTSAQHRDVSRVDPVLKNACRLCGALCQSYPDLVRHRTAEHKYQIHPRERTSNVNYPIECEYCDASLISRHEHFWHVRRHHPSHLSEYKAVVAAVCETCGKGCQSTTHLHLHELRHSSPRERCEQCGRMFYDKFALGRHVASSHRDERPYSCDVCSRSFKLKGNLGRHMRIHTGEMPYECSICGRRFRQRSSYKLHVRTVHLKMPHPPRKKRKPRARTVIAIDSDTIRDINT